MAGRGKRKGTQAYKVPIVLDAVSAEVHEPYRTLLLVHAYVKLPRVKLSAAELQDVEVRGEDDITILNVRVKPAGVDFLLTYLRGFRRTVVSDYLFPLPLDADLPANETVAKRALAKIVNNRRKRRGSR